MRRWRNRNQCSHPPYGAGEDGLLSLCNGFARSTILISTPLPLNSQLSSLCGRCGRGACAGSLPAGPLLAVPRRYKTSQKREANVMPPPMSLARPLGPPVQRMKRPSEQPQFRRHSRLAPQLNNRRRSQCHVLCVVMMCLDKARFSHYRHQR